MKSISGTPINNFDLLRLIAAGMVIISHSYPLFGIQPEPLAVFTGHRYTLGAVGVHIFFVISGYLIAQSWEREPNLRRFFWKRALRVFPALIACVIFLTFVLGSLVTTLPFPEYITHIGTRLYLWNAFLYTGHGTLPGVFADTHIPYGVNGALWTLPLEWSMYMVTALLGIAGILWSRHFVWVAVALLYVHIHLVSRDAFIWNGSISLFFGTKYCLAFVISGLAYVHREKIQLSHFGAMLCMALIAISNRTEYFYAVITLAIPYLVLYLANLKLPFTYDAKRYGDYSYGLYIYAFPMQQLLIHLWGNTLSLPAYIILTFAITFGLAYLSWHMIEKPALAMKHISLLQVARKMCLP